MLMMHGRKLRCRVVRNHSLQAREKVQAGGAGTRRLRARTTPGRPVTRLLPSVGTKLVSRTAKGAVLSTQLLPGRAELDTRGLLAYGQRKDRVKIANSSLKVVLQREC